MSKTLLAAATAASVLAAAAPSGAAAATFTCSASPISGTLLGQAIDPARTGSDGCASASQTVAPLAAPLAGDTAAAQTGSGDGRAQALAWLSGARAGHLGALALPQVPLPPGIGSLAVPIGPAGQLLGLPASITVDATKAAQALVAQRALPDVPVLGADVVRTAVGGVCDAGTLVLKGLSAVDGLEALGTPIPVDQPLDTAVPLAPAQAVDFSKLDVGQIALPAGLSLDAPVVGPVLRSALQAAVAGLPTESVPAELARVTVQPARQDATDGSLRQLGPHVTVDVLGRRVADLTLGDALVAGACDAPAPPVDAAPAAAQALQCATADVVLTDVIDTGRGVRLLGVAAPRYAGRTVRLQLVRTGRTVATAVVQPDGTFAAHAPLPARAIRYSSQARYVAAIDGQRSLALKLHRRMRITGMHVANGALTIAGRIYGPLTGEDVVISRRVSCTRDVAVTSVLPDPDGRWSATVPVPDGVDAATYRATTSVFKGLKAFRTYTLPGYVSL